MWPWLTIGLAIGLIIGVIFAIRKCLTLQVAVLVCF